MASEMTTRAACVVAFLAAAITDALMAQWVRAVADGQALHSAVLSMFVAMASLAGIGNALRGSWPAVAWVCGYGVGSYVAVAYPS